MVVDFFLYKAHKTRNRNHLAKHTAPQFTDFAQALSITTPEYPISQVLGPEDATDYNKQIGAPGKANYRGPELFHGGPYLATKLDTFAIGVMMYALVAGSYPSKPRVACDPGMDLFTD
jgi:hypothetical protein